MWWYRLTNGLFYLLAGVWAGALVGFALMAPAVFYTVRAYQPELTRRPAGAEGLEGPGSAVLAGAIVQRVFERLDWVQVICATGVVGLALLQTAVFRARLARPALGKANLIRLGCLAGAAGLLVLNLGWIQPRLWTLRQSMYNPAHAPAVRSSARGDFQWYHRLSERTTGALVLLVGGSMVLSPFVLTRDGRGTEAERNG